MPNPPDIKVFPRRLDPAARRAYYPVFTQGDQLRDILQVGEEITSFSIAATSEAAAAGLRVLSDPDFAPRYADRVFSFWVEIDPAMRSSSIFNGVGIVLGVELSFETNIEAIDQVTVGIQVVNK